MAIFIRANVELTEPLPETPTLPAVPFTSDSFNRPDGALGAKTDALLGGAPVAWTGPAEAFKIQGNRATVTGLGGAYFVGVAAPSPDVEAALTVHTRPGGAAAFMDVRRTVPGDCVRASIGTAAVSLLKRVGGTQTSLGEAVPYAAGDRVALRIKGTSVQLLVNGRTVTSATVTDAQLQYAGSVGLAGTAAVLDFTVDDFTLTNLD